MKKLLVITITLLITAVLLTACAQPQVPPVATPPQENVGSDSGSQQDQNPSAKISDKAEDAQGKLIGRIDNNSVEIELTPEDTLAFRVTDVLDQLEGIKDGDMVKFSYKQNEYGQMIITKIEKLQ